MSKYLQNFKFFYYGDPLWTKETYMKLKIFLIMNTAILIFFVSQPSVAICTHPIPRIQTLFTRSDAAFIGTVVSKRPNKTDPNDKDYDTGFYFGLKVKRLFRGPNKKVIEVYEDNDSGRMALEIGHTYLIFVTKQKDGKLQGWCYDAREINNKDDEKNYSLKIEAVIKKIKAGANGDIQGLVLDRDSNGIADVHFTITVAGGVQTYKTVSDKDGFFHVSVPAGNYFVGPSETKWQFKTTEYSLDQNYDVDVLPGGGGEVEFMVEPK